MALAKELRSQTSLDMERVAERVGLPSSRRLRRGTKGYTRQLLGKRETALIPEPPHLAKSFAHVLQE